MAEWRAQLNATVFGASGFIGAHLTQCLRAAGTDVMTPARDFDLRNDLNLGDVYYCIGLTADFRTRPFDTVEAHVTYLQRMLTQCRFESLLYLSSTRVYARSEETNESSPLPCLSADPSDLYNLSKLMGESLCLSQANPRIRAVRLSNVLGADISSQNFVPSLIRDAINTRQVTFRTSKDSAKDYISVFDVAEALGRITATGKHRLYNLASGRNTTNLELATSIKMLTGAELHFKPQAPRSVFQQIDTSRLVAEFPFVPTPTHQIIASIITQIGASKT